MYDAPPLPGAVPLLRAQLRYQVLLLARAPRALFAAVLLPLALLVLRSGGDPEPALVAGLTVLGAISTAYLTHAVALVTARQDGVLRRWWASPLPRWCFFAARIAATVLLAVAAAAVTLAAAVAFYHLDVSAAGAAALLGVVTLGALACSAVGTAVTAAVPAVDSAQPLLSLSFYPLMLLSGAFGPVHAQPGWLTAALRWLPAQPMIDATMRALAGGGLPGRDAAVLAAWAGAGLAGSLAFFRWQPR